MWGNRKLWHEELFPREETRKQEQLNAELAQLSGKSLTPMNEIAVNVNAPAACKATFTLNYYVKNAGWFPSYDVRWGW